MCIRDRYQDEYNTNDNPLNGVRTQVDYNFIPFNNANIDLGYQYRDLSHKGDFIYERRTSFSDPFILVPEFSSEVNLKRKIHSFFGQLSAKKEKFNYSAGFRIEFMDRELQLKDQANTVDEKLTYDYTKLYPSASLNFNLNEKTNFIGAIYPARLYCTKSKNKRF